ncbi:MAG TPA: A/G-specific adenine glycosylase [Candidatus Sulfotelmatobacter sp.]|nr:A/G-specific adenine glycosylase [Candidatus Sulfotelmatobacter sp.]
MLSSLRASIPLPNLAVAEPFRRRLLRWYDRHARALPWRETRDPYYIWLSEIMLQQTRVAAVIAHYREFLRRFPTVQKLAAARESSVLAAWSGLGYYRRARMLHAAAKLVVKKHGGEFPKTAEDLKELPGIGRYTAAAIASIAFNQTVAVVDGNVERVLQRVLARTLKNGAIWASADHLLDPSRPGDFNQAMMELGATVCTPRSPSCLTCPVIELCATRGELPSNGKPASQTKREIHYALFCRRNGTGNVRTDRGEMLLVQRPKDSSLMPGMWELPEIAAPPTLERRRNHSREAAAYDSPGRQPRVSVQNGGASPAGATDLTARTPLFTVRHSITTTDYTVQVWQMRVPPKLCGQWIRMDRAHTLPLTGLARKILRKAAIFVESDKTSVRRLSSSKIKNKS